MWVAAAFKIIPLVISAVRTIEAVSTAKGKQKQDAAVDMVGDLIPLVESTISREVANEDEVKDAIRKVIDAVVALLNVVRDVSAKARK